MRLIHSFFLIGADERQRRLAELLAQRGFCVESWPAPGSAPAGPLPAALDRVEAVLLPVPALQPGGAELRAGAPLRLETVLDRLRPGAVLFGGGLSGARTLLQARPIRVLDYLEDPLFAAENAAITAEAAICIAMQRLPRTLRGCPCLVLGWGRIGVCLARQLSALGAEVTVAARSPSARALCRALGLKSVGFDHLCGALPGCRCVFNTVPAPVFSREAVLALPAECIFLELASAPGGLAPEVPIPQGFLAAPGLPGRMYPESAAACLLACILRFSEKGDSHGA